MYIRVFAPDGEPFEVSRDLADRLILQEGWTQTKPIVSPTATATEKAKKPADETELTRPARGRKTNRLRPKSGK